MSRVYLALVSIAAVQAFLITKAFAESKAKYDPFSDKTEISLSLNNTRQLNNIEASSSFPGRKPKQDVKILLGFNNTSGLYCPRVRFIADGVRISVTSPLNSNSDGLLGAAVNPATNYIYNFDIFSYKEVQKIANASNVQYKLCNTVYKMSQQEKNELKYFLKLFNFSFK